MNLAFRLFDCVSRLFFVSDGAKYRQERFRSVRQTRRNYYYRYLTDRSRKEERCDAVLMPLLQLQMMTKSSGAADGLPGGPGPSEMALKCHHNNYATPHAYVYCIFLHIKRAKTDAAM